MLNDGTIPPGNAGICITQVNSRAECRVQPLYSDVDENINFENKTNKVTFQSNKKSPSFSEATSLNISGDDKGGVQTRSMTRNNDLQKHADAVHNFYSEQLNHVCLDSVFETILTVEIPVKDHGRKDCVEAKQAELQNLLNFQTFETTTYMFKYYISRV